MEQNNFLRLPTGMTDARNRARWAEDSGYYSYDTPLHCLYHLFDCLADLREKLTHINVWVIQQLMVTRPFTEAWNERGVRDTDLRATIGNGMFPIDALRVYDIVFALSIGSPSEYRLNRGEVVEEWRLYCARGGEL